MSSDRSSSAVPFSVPPKLKVVGTNNVDEVLNETFVAVSELLVAEVVFSRSSGTVSGRVVLRLLAVRVVTDTDGVVADMDGDAEVAGNKVVSPTGLFVSVVET